MIAALVGVASIAAYVQMTPGAARVADELRKPEAQASQPPAGRVEVKGAPKRTEYTKAKYLIPIIQKGDVSLAGDLGNPASGEDEHVFVVNKTFQSMGVSEGRALKIELKDKVANIHVNPGMAQHGYGSMEEAQMIKALQLGLGQFPEIERFKLWLEGEPVELGHMDLTEPVEVIRADAAPDKA